MAAIPKNHRLRVIRKGVEENPWEDIYHRLLRMSWPWFFALTLAGYLLINTIFAALYWLLPGGIAHIENGDFFSYFAFSVQTMSTVGYGYFYPQSHLADALVVAQTGASLIYAACLTGLVFAKFSTPVARVIFSENILCSTWNSERVFVVRLGNFRANRVFEGKARMTLLRDEISQEGEKLRRLIDLKLLRSETPLFSLSWTLFHQVDQDSPLKGVSVEEMRRLGWEIIVTFNGLDEDLERTIVAHSIYSSDHILQAKKFVDMIDVVNGVRVIDFSKLNEIEY